MTTETLAQCPICEASHFEPFLAVKDYTVSRQQFQIVRCGECGFLFTNPRPGAEAIGAYYASADYISHHDEAKDLLSRVYTSVRNYTTRQKLNLVKKFVPNRGRLLDIGCGTGFFLSKALADGWEVVGTEPDEQARAVGRSRVGGAVYESIESTRLRGTSFQAITMWHVLEHVHRLNETFEWLRQHLAKDGSLFIAVPNPEAPDARYFGEHWAAYDVPRHLYHFTKSTLNLLAQRHGFQVNKVLPMWFDSYYVGMLSTRYREGRTDLLDSFRAGTLSNWSGRASDGSAPNTSSLIYVLSKTQ